MNVSNLLLATKNKKRLYKSKKNTLKSFQMQSTSYKPKVQSDDQSMATLGSIMEQNQITPSRLN